MIQEHDQVILTRPIPTDSLEIGDIGAVVHIYGSGEAYEVEFVTLTGRTASVVTVSSEDIRSARSEEIPHARELLHT